MRNDKHIAMRLRREGKSYKEIQRELGIPLSTLSGWFSNAEWSQNIRKNLESKLGNKLSIAGKRRWKEWRQSAQEDGKKTYPQLRVNSLFIAGIMLYWGEGDNKLENSYVRLGNTNPNMMRLFRRFLVEICQIPEEKLRAGMILYPDLNESVSKDFWSKATGIPKNQFYKTQYIQGRHPSKRLSNGILQITHCNRQLKEKIAIWIDMFQKEHP